MARALARAGAHVALHASQTEPAALAAAIASEHGVQTACFAADLERRTETASLVPRTLERFGRLDVLVNNAGIIRRADARDFSDEDWDAARRDEVDLIFYLTRAAWRRLIAGSGVVVNMASLPSTVMLVTGAVRRGDGGKGICPLAVRGPSRKTAAAHSPANTVR